MYVAMVPFITLAMGEKSPWTVWLGVVLALVGMFLLCIKGDSLAFAWADWLAIASSAFSAIIIVVTGLVVNRISALLLVCGECAVTGVVSLVLAFIFEPVSMEAITAAAPEILYMAFYGTALAFTVQAIGQREVEPAVTSILISLESVFAVIFGFLFLHEVMTGRELLGCVFVFAATVISNLPQKTDADGQEPNGKEGAVS